MKIGIYFNPRTREGCDKFDRSEYNGDTISIHAPAKGATSLTYMKIILKPYFNPRTREGCDISDSTYDQWSHISIHAPAKGATCIIKNKRRTAIFQSTHPRRVRQVPISTTGLVSYFNPRTREGCDEKFVKSSKDIMISIHAPAKGATLAIMEAMKADCLFQSTHPRRVRPFEKRLF